MAILKLRLNRRNADGSYDPVHLETSSELVLRPDGSTVEDVLSDVKSVVTEVKTDITKITPSGIGAAPVNHTHSPASIGAAPETHNHDSAYAPKSHSHGDYASVSHNHDEVYAAKNHTHNYAGSDSEGGAATSAVKLKNPRSILVDLSSTSGSNFDGTRDVTPGVTGVLPVTNGGTGATSLDALKQTLAIGPYSPSTWIAGEVVQWAGYTWIVVHKIDNAVYLGLDHIHEICQFSTGTTSYSGSTLATRAKAFENSLPADALSMAKAMTIRGVTAKIWVPTNDQVSGGFSHFSNNTNRWCRYNGSTEMWWTSTPSGTGGVNVVSADGAIGHSYLPTLASVGFRPFVALTY